MIGVLISIFLYARLSVSAYNFAWVLNHSHVLQTFFSEHFSTHMRYNIFNVTHIRKESSCITRLFNACDHHVLFCLFSFLIAGVLREKQKKTYGYEAKENRAKSKEAEQRHRRQTS